MKQIASKRRLRAVNIILATLTALAVSSPILAEPRNGGYIQLEPMYMDVFGNDTHIANIERRFSTGTGSPGSPFSNTSTSEGVDFEFDGDFAFRGELGYMRNQWGLGVNGFWFSPDGNLSRTVDVATNAVVGGSVVGPVVSVDVEGNVVSSDLSSSPGANNRATFNVDSELSVWTTDFYGIRTLAEKPDSNIHILAGVKIGSIEHEVDGLTTTTRTGVVPSGFFAFGNPQTSTAHSSSDTDVLFGPLIAIAGDANWGKHRVNGLLMQSMVFGDVDFENSFREEVDSNLTIPGPESISIGSFQKNEDVAIPVTELRIKYLYDVLDNLSLGIGGYAAVWVDAPTAPGADISTSAARSEFNSINEQTLVFLGGAVTAELRF